MAKVYLIGSYSQQAQVSFVKSGLNRQAKTKAALKKMGLKMTSYDYTRGEYDFVATVEGTWEQVSGVLIMANASGDFDKAMALEAIPEKTLNQSLDKARGAYKPPSKK
jgi:uncharacterized protein with GYD domain|tara:strand:- start:58 stop:381 length:324 start_codon:yes stop_codon:yes gene_type:complete